MPKVEFSQENGISCICGQCPVQLKSICVKEKMQEVKRLMEKKIMPKPDGLPRLYCSSGIAACKDIDSQQMCICGDCPVWAKLGLVKGKPAYHFCTKGESV